MTKKSFINGLDTEDQTDPVMQFISTPRTEPQEPNRLPIPQGDPGRPPEGYKLDPRFIEKKTRRLQLVLQPSLYEKVKAQADKEQVSVNQYVSAVLENATKEG